MERTTTTTTERRHRVEFSSEEIENMLLEKAGAPEHAIVDFDVGMVLRGGEVTWTETEES